MQENEVSDDTGTEPSQEVYFKAGCTPVALRELGEIYHCSRALLVTDPELYRAGIAAPVVDLLRKQGIRAAEFSP